MTMPVSFFVAGTPVTQGSKRLVTRRGLTQMLDVKRGPLRAWRDTVAMACARAGAQADASGPVWVEVEFYLPRPKSHYLPGGGLSSIGKRWPMPTRKGRDDLDKLMRAVFDALTGVAYDDDSRVVRAPSGKQWAGHTGASGARIRITYLTQQ